MKKIIIIFIAVFSAWAYINASATPDQSPLPLHLFPQDQKVKEGDVATWYLTAAGAEPLQYQWKINGKEIPGANANTLRILTTKSADQGIYTCSIKNQYGEISTDPVNLMVLSGTEVATSQPLNIQKAPAGAAAQSAIPVQP